MNDTVSGPDRGAEAPYIAAAQGGDEAAFARLTEPYRRLLQVHCYRMLGSFEDAEDLVQETFVRAWRKLSTFDGRSLFRTWLYQIATNACLDALRGRKRRILPMDVVPAGDPVEDLPNPVDLPWLQPYPDRLLEPRASSLDEPSAVAIEHETIELAFLVAIQALPPKQRAVLIVRDVLDWSAAETASLLDTTVAAVNSALQRAHETMRTRLPTGRSAWAPPTGPTEDERDLLRRYMEAHEQRDVGVFATLLRDDVRLSMPPIPAWFDGRTDVVMFHEGVFAPETGHIRGIATSANGQPAAALYLRSPGDTEYRRMGIDVLRIEGGRIAEITTFLEPELFDVFGLPDVLG
jgi:RNA polymerase sigma-70 factor (ECF subfamily)